MEQNDTLNSELIQQIALLENIAKQNMTKEAIARYGNLKLAHQETALKVAASIAQAAQIGQLTEPLNDLQLKQLLMNLQQGKKQFNLKISRK